MIEHRPFQSLGVLQSDWLKARLHFRVGETGRAEHMPLGPLYVWNDDEFAPRSGFGLHAHRNVEIVTWVRSGAITHEDDAGNRARLVADSVQVMSAGATIYHAERNEEDAPARLFQIWFRPRTTGGTPRWATRVCSRESREGHFVTLASGDPRDVCAGALPINADARVRVSDCAIPTQDISWLLRFFEQRVADGERFHAGETVEIGWMLTKLEAAADGSLCVTEPDLNAILIKFIDSVDHTLKHLRNQKDVVESIAPTRRPYFPSLRQSAVVTTA